MEGEINMKGLGLDAAIATIIDHMVDIFERGDSQVTLIYGSNHGKLIRKWIWSPSFGGELEKLGIQLIHRQRLNSGATAIQIAADKLASVAIKPSKITSDPPEHHSGAIPRYLSRFQPLRTMRKHRNNGTAEEQPPASPARRPTRYRRDVTAKNRKNRKRQSHKQSLVGLETFLGKIVAYGRPRIGELFGDYRHMATNYDEILAEANQFLSQHQVEVLRDHLHNCIANACIPITHHSPASRFSSNN